VVGVFTVGWRMYFACCGDSFPLGVTAFAGESTVCWRRCSGSLGESVCAILGTGFLLGSEIVF